MTAPRDEFADATPRPWYATHNGNYIDLGVSDKPYCPKIGDLCASKWAFSPEIAEANAALIVAAVNERPALLAEVAELREILEAQSKLNREAWGQVAGLREALREACEMLEDAPHSCNNEGECRGCAWESNRDIHVPRYRAALAKVAP